MKVFSKFLALAMAALIGLSANTFAVVGTPAEEAAALQTLVLSGATKAQVATFVKSRIAEATDKKAMAAALIAIGASDQALTSTIASAAIAAAGRTSADAQAVARGLIAGGGAANAQLITAAIKLSAGTGDAALAVVGAAVSEATTAFGAQAGTAAQAGADTARTTLVAVSSDNLQATADASVAAFNDNTGALSPVVTSTEGTPAQQPPAPPSSQQLIAAVTPPPPTPTYP